MNTPKRRALLWGVLGALALSTLLLAPSAHAAPRTPVAGTQRLWLEGTSITAGVVLPDSRDRLGVRVATDLHIDPARIINRGVSGRTLAQLAAAWPSELALMTPGDGVFIEIGMNDINPAVYPGDGYFAGTYTSIVSAAANAGMYIQVEQITPIGAVYSTWEPKRQQLNGWLLSVYGAGMVLQYSLPMQVSATNTWINGRYAADQIHPDEAGTGVMAHMMSARIATASWWLG